MDSDIRTLNVQEEQEMSLHSGSSGKPFSFSWGGVLPGSPVIKNLLCNAGMWVPSLFGGTKIPHAEEKLSPHATTTKAQTAQLKSRCPAMQQNKLIFKKEMG